MGMGIGFHDDDDEDDDGDEDDGDDGGDDEVGGWFPLISQERGADGNQATSGLASHYHYQCNSTTMQCNAMQCNAMQCNAMQCNAI